MAEVAIGLVLGPFRRYRNFDEDVKKFHGSLQTQKTIFRNFCELLLKTFVNNEVAVRVLNRTTDASEELDHQLSVVLGSSAEACMRIVEAVEAILCKIAEEKFLEVDIEDEEKRRSENTTTPSGNTESAPASLRPSESPPGTCRPSHHQSSLDKADYIKDGRSPDGNPHHGKVHTSSSDKQSRSRSLDQNHHHTLKSPHNKASVSVIEPEKELAQSRRRKFMRKLLKAKFSTSKTRLDDYLTQLKSLNSDFGTLQVQIQQLAKSQSLVISSTSRPLNKNIRHFRIIQKSSKQLYDVLAKSCTLHSEHIAHFSVEAEHTEFSSKSPLQINFNLALTHRTSRDSHSTEVPLWMVIESTSLDGWSETTTRAASFVGPRSLMVALKRECNQASISQNDKRQKKSVRFEATIPNPSNRPPRQAFPAPGGVKDVHICKAGNLCTIIRASLGKLAKGKSTHTDSPRACIGVLDQNDEYRQVVYPGVRQSMLSDLITLSEILSKRSLDQSGLFSQYERIRLARKLATATLQYHATPWLRTAWRSRDVYFFDSLIESFPKIAAPHFMTKITPPDRHMGPQTDIDCQPFAFNQVLFGLGVVLLELGHEATLKSMQRPNPLTQIDPNHAAASIEFLESQRLGNLVGNRMGSRYGRIVTQCLRCDFRCGADLDDNGLQERVYKDVICELEALELKFKALEVF